MPAVFSKTFQHYLDLPSEVRIMVIDEMETKDRIVFSTISKTSNREAKKSKNYISDLGLRLSESSVSIHVGHGIEIVDGREQELGFKMYFENGQGINYIVCQNCRNVEIWRTFVEDSIDIVQFGLQHFKNILKFYQSRIKSLTISVQHPMVESDEIDFEIQSLNNLNSLNILYDADIRQFFPKIRKTLKELSILYPTTNRKHLRTLLNDEVECEKIYKVQECLRFPVEVNYQQMLRFSASHVFNYIGQLTEVDISNFIKSWQNGTLGRNVKHHQWTSTIAGNPILDFRVFANLLGFPQHNFTNGQRLEIPHLKNETETAVVYFDNFLNSWVFDTDISHQRQFGLYP